jgi:hypothetical protein
MLDFLVAFSLYHFQADYKWWIGFIIVVLIETIQDINNKYGVKND